MASFYYSKVFYLANTVPNALKIAWEWDLSLSLSVQEWKGICWNSQKMSRDIGIRLIQFKILHQFTHHLLNFRDQALRKGKVSGPRQRGHYIPWPIQNLWKQVHKCITEISEDFHFEPRLYVYWVILYKFPIIVCLAF